MVVLDLAGNPLGDGCASQLATYLSQDAWMWALRLHGCGLTTVGCSALLQALLGNEGLVALDIRGNDCEGGWGVVEGAGLPCV